MTDKTFPILSGGGRHIPWIVAEKAYWEYAKRYGTGQSIERIAERGGFAESELDGLYPDWRTESDEVEKMRDEIEQLQEWIVELNGFRAAAASCIKSGEDWTPVMQAAFERSAKPVLTKDSQPHAWVNQGICCRLHATAEQKATTMIVCPECGDKRCAKASMCDADCDNTLPEKDT